MMKPPPYRYHALPCAGPRCGPDTGQLFRERLKELCPDRKELGVRISATTCQGMCELGPNLTVYPEGVVYHGLREGDLERIVEEHFRRGRPVHDLLERQPRPDDDATASD